jgi:aminopeptidase N
MAWFPGNHHPSDKASYDIRITVPEGLTAVSNGELRSARTTGGRTAFVWHSAEPMASYLATVVIGPYRTRETEVPKETAGGKGTAGRRETAGALPVYTAVDPSSDPSVAQGSAKLLAAIPAIMKWEQGTFGPYPFSSTGVIIGREADAGYALETQTRPFLPGPTDTVTLVHELAHQWFGDSVTPKTWRDMWLNEGFATYAEWLWNEHTARVPVGRSFTEAYDNDENWAFPPARPPTAADISQAPVYGRGAMVLQRVRLAVGDDTFFRIVRGWARTYRHGNASTADFTAYVEKVSGRDLDRLWDDWLYGDAKPSLGQAG